MTLVSLVMMYMHWWTCPNINSLYISFTYDFPHLGKMHTAKYQELPFFSVLLILGTSPMVAEEKKMMMKDFLPQQELIIHLICML